MSTAPTISSVPGPAVRPPLVVGLAAVIVVLGLFLVASGAETPGARRRGRAPDHYVLWQALSSLLGVLGLLLAYVAGSARVRRWAGPALGVLTALSVLTVVPGVGISTGGARRTVSILGLGFQPTILAIAVLPVVLGYGLDREGALRRAWLVPVVLGVGAAVCLLQPNFGHLGVLLATVLGVLAGLGRAARRPLLGVLAVGFLTGPVALAFPYVRWRVASFFDPDLTADTQALQGILSGLSPLGMGLERGWEKVRLSAAPTDYLYAVTLEELGLLGGLAVLALLIGLVVAAAGLAQGPGSPERAVAWGTAGFIAFPALTHVLVNLRLAPVTGIHLPLLSYSGSANVAILIALGLACVVCQDRRANAEAHPALVPEGSSRSNEGPCPAEGRPTREAGSRG